MPALPKQSLVLSTAAALAAAVCLAEAPGESPQTLERRFEGLGAAAVVQISPGVVRPEADVEAVLRVEAPTGGSATLPQDIATRFEGFEPGGSYTGPDGALHVRLVPAPAAPRYRLKPFAVEVTSPGGSHGWFATTPVDLQCDGVLGAAPGELSGAPGYVPIGRSPREILHTLGVVCAAALALAAAAFGVSRLRRHRRIRRMSPRERALRELRELLARDLPGKARFKDYYIELTMVVRRYIERRHGVRAPRQTTEEFLNAVSGDAAFGETAVARLRSFLSAADLVKFAGRNATEETAAVAADKARQCIEDDGSGNAPTAKGDVK